MHDHLPIDHRPNNRRPNIVVVGSVNVDMVVRAERIPEPGETVTGGTFLKVPGGKGANQAVAAARLGADVTLIARVGDDQFGRDAIDGYEREGIRTDLITRDPERSTGVALIVVDAAGENCISVASGANHALSPDDIDRAADRIRSADIVLLQLEVPLAANLQAARIAAENGVKVILDPAPVSESRLLPELFPFVECLTPNETEATQLTGILIRDAASAHQAATALLELGAKRVIVTLGERGCVLADRFGQHLMLPAVPVTPIDTTAAGDAFNAALGVELARQQPIAEALKLASLVGALTTTKPGAQPALPTTAEVQEFQRRRTTPVNR